jgi:hypothetical protein
MSDNELATVNICLAYMNIHASKFNGKSNQLVALPSVGTAFHFVLHAR